MMTTYATLVPLDVVEKSGTRTKFPTAVHRDHALCIEAAYKIRDDFVSKVGMALSAKTIGEYPVLGRIHFVAFTIPECLPERLALMTRLIDFTILADDYYDTADSKEVTAFNTELQRSLSSSNESTGNETSLATKTKQFQASILVDMMAVDHDLAMEVMTSYSSILEVATSPPTGICSIEDYLPIRSINAGFNVFQDISCFGLGLHLTQVEKAKLSEVVNPALDSAALLNDYYSWPKELQHHLETPDSDAPFNAVCILMRQYGCSDIEASEKLQGIYVALQERHLSLVRKLEHEEGTISDTHYKYIMAAQHAASGSEFWSIFAPRYPTKEDLDQPEYVLLDGVFQQKHTLSNDLSLDRSVAHPNGAIEPDGTGRSQPNMAVVLLEPAVNVVKTHSEQLTDVSDTNGESETRVPENGHLDNSSKPCKDKMRLWKKPSEDAVRSPYDYISSLPSKKVRNTFIDALDAWLEVPATSLSSIKSIVDMLHNSSLMLDDIEDDSMLRRGRPTAHTLFGTAQTINSANYVLVCALEELQKLQSPDATRVYTEELKNLYCGQALDLHWKYHTHIPTVDDYMMMVDNKTGGLFRLCVRLMQGESSVKSKHIDSGRFVTILGRYFQIRDDYQNLMSDEYASQKGFCEDLDEGKISLPLIYYLTESSSDQIMIKGILKNKGAGKMPMELKTLILERMRQAKAFDSTRSLLQEMQEDMIKELRLLEDEFGTENPILELVLRRLWV